MAADVVALDAHPYDSWDEGLLALCDAMPDLRRLPAVLRRLERTAERQGVTVEDLCVLMLTTPPEAPEEPEEEAEPQRLPPQPVGPRLKEYMAAAERASEAIEAPRRQREDVARDAFGPGDDRRLLVDTIWGLPAATLVDASDRLGLADPFRRLGARLALWFAPSVGVRWMGVPLGQDVLGIWDLAARLLPVARADDESGEAARRLLRLALGHEPLGRDDAADTLSSLVGAVEGMAAQVLCRSVMAALLADCTDAGHPAAQKLDVALARAIRGQLPEAAEGGRATGSLPGWLHEGRRPPLLPDLRDAVAAVGFRIHDWPEGRAPRLAQALTEMLARVGPTAWPDGALPLVFDRNLADPETSLPALLAPSLPEAHDLMRLLSLRSGDWSEGGEFGGTFWGDPAGADGRTMDLRTACANALSRGDPALADMLLGGWLLARLAAGLAVPHPADIGRTIRNIPAEERVSTQAVLALLQAEGASAPVQARHLAGLLSYLPPLPPLPPPDAEAELREHLTEPGWATLADEEQRRLLETERSFRDWRRLGAKEAEMRGPAVLLTPWAALFESLLRRALRHAHRDLLPRVHDRTTLGELVGLMRDAWDLAAAEAWPDDDPRRRHLIGDPWHQMLHDLNTANRRVKHPGEAPPGWPEVAKFRARLIYGGALARALEAAGPPVT